MSNSTKIILQTQGLVDSPNNLSLEDGALEIAENVIIKREGVIEPRRGYKLIGSELPDADSHIEELLEFHDRLLRYYNNKLQYQSDAEFNFVDFLGDYEPATDEMRIKYIESSGNLFFTSSDGVKKISAKNGDDLKNAQIESAGGTKALDFEAELIYEYGKQNGIVEQDSKVGYRIVYNKRDRNNILIQGAPSQTVVVENPISKLLVQDFTHLLDSLDQINVSNPTGVYEQQINDADYVFNFVLPITATGTELRTNMIDLAKKLDQDITLANGTNTSAKYIIDEITIDGDINTDSTLTITIRNTAGVSFSDYLTLGDSVEFSNFIDENGVYLSKLNDTLFKIIDIKGTNNDSIVFEYENIANNPLHDGSQTFPYSIQNKPKMVVGWFRTIQEPTEFSVVETHGEFIELQNYLINIIYKIQDLSADILPRGAEYDKYISTLTYTTSLDVKIKTQIPQSLTEEHFIQIYRTQNFTTPNELNINDIFPNEEFQLAYEEYLTQDELTLGYLEVVDITNDSFLGSYLYTNDATGEGDVNANFKPPFATDINRFKNVTFYANTRTQHRFKLDLVGIEQIRNSGLTNMFISVTRGNQSISYKLIQGVKQSYTIDTVDDNAGSLNDTYFILFSHLEDTMHVFFYSTDDDPTEPDLSATYPNYTINYHRIQIVENETANIVASKTADKINTVVNTFEVTDLTNNQIKLNNIKEKRIADPIDGGTGFTINVVEYGVGEDVATRTAIISSSPSTAIALDETARSLMKVINLSPDSFISGYYLSRASDIPGKMFFEANDLNSEPFYITANSSTLGKAFNPSIDEQFSSSTVSYSNGRTTITIPNHNLGDGNSVIITLTGNNADGIYTVSVVDPNNILVEAQIDVHQDYPLSISAVNYAQISENDDKKNRIFYSKFQQPEAVPLANYFDVGSEDKAILRIYPLRDSLFVFKEDGLYRISGETAPFSVQLMDSSYILIAPDSVVVVDNLVYAWTTKGIQALSESGGRVISGNIDNIIYKFASKDYKNFRRATFSIGYESDNSVILYTVKEKEDTYATVGLRYSTRTATWTSFTQSATCGIRNPYDDKIYLGQTDCAYMSQERKSFTRLDYADREYVTDLEKNKVLNEDTFILPSSFDMNLVKIGDVIEQKQTVTLYEYNMLLAKIDIDSATPTDYLATLESKIGDDLHVKVLDLARKLDSDIGSSFAQYVECKSGTITSIELGNEPIITCPNHGLLTGRVVIINGSDCNPSIDGTHVVTVLDSDRFTIPKEVYSDGTTGEFRTDNTDFNDLRVIYNKLIDELNTSTLINMHNYSKNELDSSFEGIIKDVDVVRRRVTLNQPLQFQVGNIIVYEAIQSRFLYRPITMGDPMGLKHLREATMMFEDNQFTSASIGFSTDLLPQIIEVDFDMSGNGIFGNLAFGSNFFGGVSNNAPLRTYIPREKQRCTYIQVSFRHNIAREKYALLSTTVTGNISMSTRAYR